MSLGYNEVGSVILSLQFKEDTMSGGTGPLPPDLAPGDSGSGSTDSSGPTHFSTPVTPPAPPAPSTASLSKKVVSLASTTNPAPPLSSSRTILSVALAQAQSAVLLDGANNMNEAIAAYTEAVRLLEQVMQRTSSDESRNRIRQIHATYANRFPQSIVPSALPGP
ncbi:hypothetical protein BJ684DRAFT_20905 [Piptocephalis cylindrospora]|uniref:MIT domain-containing protein n=1 Tax=Piptocephalis cylindrospora TaxID=1907219 RepID=A0A4P9Y1B9_9FUNG|nr:hypothetical protein BJ684DRAFT_20905 [Piptocephalis cylindrospora]|eukprot:RKP12567.1 hypothetical protein BJ684DRAFT_20905 [Piptocephalis cylindrospora]